MSREALALCRRGVRNVLAHLGVLPRRETERPRGDGRVLEFPKSSAYVFATIAGVFEPFHANGDEVHAGEPAGRIHVPWDPACPPVTLAFQADGVVCGQRQQGQLRPGNCCVVVAAPYRGDVG